MADIINITVQNPEPQVTILSGPAGVGLPAGGTAGQVPVKQSGTDYDIAWGTTAGGGDMLAAANLSDVASAATSFANIKQSATTSATGVVELATDGESAAGLAVQANDSRLSNARTPLAHTHDAAALVSGELDPDRLGSGSALQAVRRNAANDALEYYTPSGGGGGAVDSVHGRTGDVVSEPGDYDADQIDFTPAGGLAAENVQAALEELDTDKQPADSDLTAIAALSPSNDDVLQRKAGAWTNRTPAQLKTDLSLTKSDVGLGNVDNTSDVGKPVSTAQQAALDDKLDVGATTADVDDSADRRYVTDAQRTVIQNTSGTNTGDQTTVSGNAGTATQLQTARNINGVAFNGTANITVPAAGSTLTDPVPVGKGGTGLTALGTANQQMRVNAGATALEYFTPSGGGGSGTKTYGRWTAADNKPPATNFATLDTRNSIDLLNFDDTTQENAVFNGIIPEAADLTSGLKVRITWVAASATSGDCRWGAQVERCNGSDIDADSFDTAVEATSATNATSGIPTVTEITLTDIDSLTAGDFYRLKIYRDTGDAADTMAGDAQVIGVELRSAA
jgi:hypothetical protein